MIEINGLWLPLIITLILQFLAGMFERDQDYGFFSKIGSFSMIISLIFYICYGIYYLVTHIKIV